jgi:hypothetical protein
VITTNVVVAANALVVLAVVVGDGAAKVDPANICTGASGIVWSVLQFQRTTHLDWIAVCYGIATTGIASGTALTVHFDSTTSSSVVGGMSFAGVDTVSPVDVQVSADNELGTAAWSANSLNLAAGSVLVGAAVADSNVDATTTATNGNTLAFAKQETTSGNTGTLVYRIVVGAAAYVASGNWGALADSSGMAIAFKAAAAAGGPAPLPQHLGVGTLQAGLT